MHDGVQDPGRSVHMFNVPTKDLALVGEIVLLWGTTESVIGACLDALWAKSTRSPLTDFIHEVDFNKKVVALCKVLDDPSRSYGLTFLVGELKFAANNWRPDRNILAHGRVAYDLDTDDLQAAFSAPKIKSVARTRFVEVSNLQRSRARAAYAADVALRIYEELTPEDAMFHTFNYPPIGPRPD